MDTKAANQLALALLVAAKIFGIAGLVVGATPYRPLGGVLLACDGLLLALAVALGLRSMKTERRAEKDDKELLLRMVEEGTLQQYLREIRGGSGERPTA